MESLLVPTTLILIAYLCGAIPTGLILSRLVADIDIRDLGSHNIGATNVYRNLGKAVGALTLAGDVAKGFLPLYLVQTVTGSETWTALAAAAAFLGHLYPVYLRFSGGKGVATALGVYVAMAPQIVIFAVVIFALTLLLFRYVSLSSIAAAVAFPLLMYITPYPYPPLYIVTSLFIGAMIVVRHKENIKRIAQGTEASFGRSRRG
ncbi:MAG: glycerol-3-phosphate 1-O-acyltransferase PlsY [Deltaproteobacteria bacterium]|nr:glycerol-3-phosphate 1-O-acyltransferase PlsY [Deltaproteobacteria bacterium]